jgi:hypothetical protein
MLTEYQRSGRVRFSNRELRLNRDEGIEAPDHIIPPSMGGTHTRGNVQIAHWFCNRQKEDGSSPDPEIMRAKLTRRLYGTPPPEAMYRAEMPRYPDKRRQAVQEYCLAAAIKRGNVAPTPRPRWRKLISRALPSRRLFADR